MTANEAAQEVIARVAPQLDEWGFSSFVLCAYHKGQDADGNEIIERHVIAKGGNNAAMQDGLRPMVIMGTRWQQGQL